ncbi:MAG: thiamine-phosphate kinase [Vulcanimicrobiaceae bacterium]
MTDAAIREDQFIAALRSVLREPRGRVMLGVGDDAAIWQPSRSHRSVISSDAFVDGVHFRRGMMPPEDIGARAMAASVSDLAAMGAIGILATVSLAIPSDISQDEACAWYRGMQEVATAAKLSIVGGDLVRSDRLMLAITVVGEVRSTRAKRRDGARAGDVLAVTGPLGAARAGWLLDAHPEALTGAMRDAAVRAYRRPQPRFKEARFLCASERVHAMMDISDGLSTDLLRLCAASGVGAVVDDVPAAPEAAAMARALNGDAEQFALAGGEDFELLVAIDARSFAYLAARFAAHIGRPLLRVGTIRAELGVVRRTVEGDVTLTSTGWDQLHESS